MTLSNADDIALFSDTKSGLTNMIDNVAEESRKANLKLAVGANKTAWLTFGKSQMSSESLNSKFSGMIPKLTSYKHLGHRQENDFTSTVKDRLKLAWGSLFRMNGIWSSPLSPETKLRLYDSIVYPVLNFGTGALSISKSMLRRIDVEVNNMRRIVCQCNRLDEYGMSYPNASLYLETERFSTIHKVQRAKLVGHMLRHSSDFQELVQWKQRSNARNLSPSEACFKDLNITLEEALVFASDREHWYRLTEKLRRELEPLIEYEKIGSAKWKTALAKAKKQKSPSELQFVEESNVPFPAYKAIQIYTDGSVLPMKNTKEIRSGIGIVVLKPRCEPSRISIPLESDTIERVEILAFQHALLQLPSKPCACLFHTDSYYLWDFFHNLRYRRRIVGYKGVLNGDLFSQLDGKLRSLKHDLYSIYMCKVKGHSGNKWNDEADGLALIAERKVPRPPEQKKRKTSNDSNASQIDKSLEKLIKHRTLEKGKTKTNPAPKRGAEAKVTLCGKIAKTGGKRAPS